MKKQLFLACTILICIMILGIIVAQYLRHENSRKYHATKDCDDAELSYCRDEFKLGLSIIDFKKQLASRGLSITAEWERANSIYFSLQDILKKCPKSGRQYCGITFGFKKNHLILVESGYPCH